MMKTLSKRKHPSIRIILSIILVILGGSGCVVSLFRLGHSIQNYQNSKNLSEWSRITANLVFSTQHFAFERGRTAVILRGAEPISPGNIEFIKRRRIAADIALQSALANIHTISVSDYSNLTEKWEALRKLRPVIDHESTLPRIARDKNLPSHWFSVATDLILGIQSEIHNLAGRFLQGDTSRLIILASTALELRNVAGTASSELTQALAARERPTSKFLSDIYIRRGMEDRLWNELEIVALQLNTESINNKVMYVKNYQNKIFRPLQDRCLSALEGSGKFPDLTEITSQAPVYLDGISELSTLAVNESLKEADEGIVQSFISVCMESILFIFLITILILSLWYVGRYVVRPLEYIDKELRRIGAIPIGERSGNEIDRVIANTVALEQIIIARAESEKAREIIILELQSAIEQIKTLSGFIPICANCKKIRDDNGYWAQVEEYISKHTDVQFSHSFCPECMELLYGDIVNSSDTKKGKSLKSSIK